MQGVNKLEFYWSDGRKKEKIEPQAYITSHVAIMSQHHKAKLPHHIQKAIVLVSGNICHMWCKDRKFLSVEWHLPHQPLLWFYLNQPFYLCQEWPEERIFMNNSAKKKNPDVKSLCWAQFLTSSVSKSPLSSYSEKQIPVLKSNILVNNVCHEK